MIKREIPGEFGEEEQETGRNVHGLRTRIEKGAQSKGPGRKKILIPLSVPGGEGLGLRQRIRQAQGAKETAPSKKKKPERKAIKGTAPDHLEKGKRPPSSKILELR